MRSKILMLLALLITGSLVSASAAVISYATTASGGSNYVTSYSVAATAGESPISEFTIFFSSDLYANLVILSSPESFDSIVIQPDTGIPADGYLDALAIGGGIVFGSPQGGFSVAFTFLGSGGPGAQAFDIVEPFTFAAISSGLTTLADPQDPGNNVPEPGSMALLVLGATGLAFIQRTSRKTRTGLVTATC